MSEFIKKCPVCSSDFEYLSPNKKYCSAKCSNKARSKFVKEKYIKSIDSGVVNGRNINEHFYNRYKSSAERRGIVFLLSITEFTWFMGRDCHYCDATINTVGIDRKNNKAGYYIENCVPCCTECNKMKREMDYNSFIAHCHQVSKVIFERNN